VQRVLRRVLVTAFQVAALMAFVLFVIPDGNDYAQVTLDKHRRLDAAPGPKLVFVGGSNLAYGIDSAQVERALHRHVVNMGMNAYLGLRFLLNEVEPSLRSGDVVALSLEHELFRVQGEFDAVSGRDTDILMMLKTRPASFAYVAPAQRGAVAAAVPEVVQRKSLRVLGDLVHFGRAPKLMDTIETRAGFNELGDLVSHLGLVWPEPRDDGTNLLACPLDARVPGLLKDFRAQLAKRGVRVLLLPPPLPRSYFDKQREAIEATRRSVDAAAPGLGIAEPSRYVFADTCFFDDIHHLTGICRTERTALVIDDLRMALEASARAD
jgi:hypothetical protein